MQVRKEVLRLMGLTIAFVAMAGCVPHSLPGLMATTQPTETVAPTATSTSTATDTPTLQPTATVAPTLAPTPDRYEIDPVKLNHWPKSYDYLINHLDEFVEAPDFAGNPVVAMDWWENKLLPALGVEENLDRNVWASNPSRLNGLLYFVVTAGREKPLVGTPEFFYFKHNDVVYPTLVLSLVAKLSGVDTDVRTITMILTEELGGWESLNQLSAGKAIFGMTEFAEVESKWSVPEVAKQLVMAGFDGSVYGKTNWRLPAAGYIQTLP